MDMMRYVGLLLLCLSIELGNINIYIYIYRFNPCRSGNFTRGDLPEFDWSTINAETPAHADNRATLTANSIFNAGNAPLEYIWSYVSEPGGAKPDISTTAIGFSTTSYTFNYWEMAVGSYTIRVNMTDPDNSQFYYELTRSFEILNSCEATCNLVKWFFTHDPGSCTGGENCILGVLDGDLFTLAITPGSGIGSPGSPGSGYSPPFTLTLSYLPGSRGPATLSPDSTHFTNSFSHIYCGANTAFPTIVVNMDVPLCQSPQTELTLSGTITPRGNIITTDYTVTWVEGGNQISGTTDDLYILIPTNGLVPRGPYQYKAKIELVCLPGILWNEAVFALFYYAPNFTQSIQGSVQNLTFSDPIPVLFDDMCTDLLKNIADIGVGAICRLTALNTLEIKYGFVGGPYTGSTIYLELDPAK